MPNQKSQRGGVIVYVFIGIALFGALMFLFSRGASQNSTSFTKQQSTIKAQAIIAYADVVAQAANKLITNGISENDISFETDLFKTADGTVMNPSSQFPNCTNEKCKIFSRSGGAIAAQFPTDLGPLDPASPSSFPLRGGMIAHTVNIVDVGTSLPELVLSFQTIPKDVCIQINELLDHQFTTNPPTGDAATVSDQYTGAFPIGAVTLGDGNDAWASGKTSYCYQFTGITPNMYVYQKVAFAR